MRYLICALCLFALPALADPPAALQGAPLVGPDPSGPPLTAAEFEAYAVGKTLTYAQGGQVWGQEEYLPNHRVVWAFTGQSCQYGQWSEERSAAGIPLICFVYEDKPDPNCWQFHLGATGLTALFMGDTGPALAEVAQTDQPMQCPGPKVGV